jgi:hypothetical protein
MHWLGRSPLGLMALRASGTVPERGLIADGELRCGLPLTQVQPERAPLVAQRSLAVYDLCKAELAGQTLAVLSGGDSGECAQDDTILGQVGVCDALASVVVLYDVDGLEVEASIVPFVTGQTRRRGAGRHTRCRTPARAPAARVVSGNGPRAITCGIRHARNDAMPRKPDVMGLRGIV